MISLGHIILYCLTLCAGYAWVCVRLCVCMYGAGYPALLFQLIVLCACV